VIQEGDKSQRQLAMISAAMNTSTLREDDATRLNRQLLATPWLVEAKDAAFYCGEVARSGVVVFAHVGNSFSLDYVVKLFRADVLVRTLHHAWGDQYFMEEHDSRSKLTL